MKPRHKITGDLSAAKPFNPHETWTLYGEQRLREMEGRPLPPSESVEDFLRRGGKIAVCPNTEERARIALERRGVPDHVHTPPPPPARLSLGVIRTRVFNALSDAAEAGLTPDVIARRISVSEAGVVRALEELVREGVVVSLGVAFALRRAEEEPEAPAAPLTPATWTEHREEALLALVRVGGRLTSAQIAEIVAERMGLALRSPASSALGWLKPLLAAGWARRHAGPKKTGRQGGRDEPWEVTEEGRRIAAELWRWEGRGR